MLMSLLATCAGIILVYMTIFFVNAQIKKDNSIADIAWGPGFALIALYTLFNSGTFFPRQLLVTALVLLWATRLSSHILKRNWNKGEDARYAQWRQSWGKHATLFSFTNVFLLQGFLLLVISYPIMIINSYSDATLNYKDFLGLAMWLVGFYFEVVGDAQLAAFLKQPANRGKILMSGLWKYTRHPNYFGEALLWWGIFVIALSVPYGYTSIVSPVLITYLLVFVSGIPLAEKQLEKNDQFADYKKRTSSFIPWFINQD
ncbi:hypothetical protein Noda2021_11570 [Candidatus Dependentiae bacterium Noda2021]|nr:hypothetical protein Noda2021_11570 [Candidatus Dependentiae bacterium Noda2021]